MRMYSSVLAAAVMVAMLAPTRAKEPNYDFGPVPAWGDFQALAETAVRNRLRDPDSAKFRWPWGLGKIYKKSLLSTLAGYSSCGYVNARNAYGGYTGDTAFSVLIDHGRVVDVVIDTRPGGYIEQQCLAAAIKPGGLRPRSTDATEDTPGGPETAAPSGTAGQSRFGLRLIQVPDGAYIATVAPDSTAEKVGIKSGMVIEQVNGLSIKGLPLKQLN